MAQHIIEQRTAATEALRRLAAHRVSVFMHIARELATAHPIASWYVSFVTDSLRILRESFV